MPHSAPNHTFHEICLHVNWHCADDRRLIITAVERELFAFIRSYCGKMESVYLKGIGGTETHIHLALQIEPQIAASEAIGKIKGASSHAMNERFGAGTLAWQRGYGVVSFAAKHLESVLDYIARQKEHHASGRLNERLEIGGDPAYARTPEAAVPAVLGTGAGKG